MKNSTILIGLVVLCLQPAFASRFEHTSGLRSPKKQYDNVVKFLEGLEQKFSQTTEVFTLGISDSGISIKGVKIGDGTVENIVVGTHHGNEYGSTEVAMAFAADLAARPIVGQTIYVIPVLNINGYNLGQRQERNTFGQSFDPNRDYSGPCKPEAIFGKSFNLKSTAALADFVARKNIINSATLHTYHPAVMYPWGISTDDLTTGYEDLFIDLGNLAAKFSGYAVGNSTALLYPADGTYEDYAFWQHGIWSMLFELGFTHSPTEKQIREMIAVNVPGMRLMFENSPVVRAPAHGFSGVCTQASLLLDRHDE